MTHRARALLLFCISLSGATACGGGTKKASPDLAAPFAGTWTIQSGSVTTTCPDAGPGNSDAGFSYSGSTSTSYFSPGADGLTFEESSPTELSETETGLACQWTWTVSGSVATMTGANTCSYDSEDPAGNNATFISTALDSATISDGTMTETLGGSAVIIDSGQSVTCVFSGSLTLTQD